MGAADFHEFVVGSYTSCIPVLSTVALKRPPMAFSSSADGVVVQRNIVVAVGTPAQATPVALRQEGIEVTDEGVLVHGLAAHRWRPEPASVDGRELPAEVLYAVDRLLDQ